MKLNLSFRNVKFTFITFEILLHYNSWRAALASILSIFISMNINLLSVWIAADYVWYALQMQERNNYRMNYNFIIKPSIESNSYHFFSKPYVILKGPLNTWQDIPREKYSYAIKTLSSLRVVPNSSYLN